MEKRKKLFFKWSACALLSASLFTAAAMPSSAASSRISSADSTVSAASSETSDTLGLESAAGLVADVDTGQIYYQKASRDRMYPASLTKLMTGLVAAKYGNMNDIVTIPEDVSSAENAGFANIALQPGDTITMSQLMYVMFLASANDCSIAVADHVGGSVSQFVAMMNQEAASLGAVNTHFSNPDGLPDVNNYTTAYDMALIARAAAQNATLMTYFSAKTYTLPASTLRTKAVTYTTLHRMMKQTVYYDADVIAGKTGWETMSLNTLVTVARKNGRTLVAVSMYGANAHAVYGDSRKMIDYAFAQPANSSAEKLVAPAAAVQSTPKTVSKKKAAVTTSVKSTRSVSSALTAASLEGLLTLSSIGLFAVTLTALLRYRRKVDMS